MLKLFIFLPICTMFCQSPWGIVKTDNGILTNYRIDKIFVNPMSNPTSIFTKFNLPDSLEASISVTNKKLDTVFIQKNIALAPGEYEFFLNYNMYPMMTSGEYIIHFEFRKKNELIYYSAMRTLFLSSIPYKEK